MYALSLPRVHLVDVLRNPLAARQLLAEIDRLKQELTTKNKMLFGKKSEKRGRGKKKRAGTKQTGHGPTEQSDLPQIERVHEVSGELKCPSCGSGLIE